MRRLRLRIDFEIKSLIVTSVKSQRHGIQETPAAIRKTFALIRSQLREVEERIRAQSHAFDPAVEGYVAYACESNGKRLRPALALLAAGASGGIRSSHIDLAVIVELIHAATLVHDDIMDGADKRRGQPTANSRWGNSLSVLLGDCLFAHALKLSTSFANHEISHRIACAASDVCSGEIMQTQRRFDLKLSLADYYKIIEMKTAALFAVATELAAEFNGASPETVSIFKNYGLKLGVVYQIYDDCLDIAGDESEAGKTLGSDLRKGKLTLPVLNLLREASAAEQQRLNEIILRGNDDDCAELSRMVQQTGALAASAQIAQNLLEEASRPLETLPENSYTTGLQELAALLGKMVGQFAV